MFVPAFVSNAGHSCSGCDGLTPSTVTINLTPDMFATTDNAGSFTINYFSTVTGAQQTVSVPVSDTGGSVTITTAGPMTISGSSSNSNPGGEEWCLESDCAPLSFMVFGGAVFTLNFVYYDAFVQSFSDSFGGTPSGSPAGCLTYIGMPMSAGSADTPTASVIALSSSQTRILALPTSTASVPAYFLDSSGVAWTPSATSWTISGANAIPSSIVYSSTMTTETNVPSVSATCVEGNQPLTVQGTLPSGATFTDWLTTATSGGTTIIPPDPCSTAVSGSTVTCSIAANTLTPGDMYNFELNGTNSDGSVFISSPSSIVTVSSALSPPNDPVANATALAGNFLDSDQDLTVNGSVPSTGVGPYSWEWLVTDGGSSYPPPCAATGSDALPGTVETCNIPSNTLRPGIYNFQFDVTSDSASSPESSNSTSTKVTVNSALSAPSVPIANATSLDQNQNLTITSTLPSTGTAYFAFQWMYSFDGGPYALMGSTATAPDCTPISIFMQTSFGSGYYSTPETCKIPGSELSTGYYNFELNITDSAGTPETSVSPPSAVTVSSALTSPPAPTVSATVLDADQALTLTDTILTGTAPYIPTWTMVSGGVTSSAPCSSTSESGDTLTCTIAGNTLNPGTTYSFELQVTDSATKSETSPISPASSSVTVNTPLAPPSAPSVSTTGLNVAQPLTVTGAIPSSGTSPYNWQWLISIGGGAYKSATQCATNSGTGALAGAPETCYIPGGTLAAGPTYNFELQVTDSATTPETVTSSPSQTVVTQVLVTFIQSGLGSSAIGTVLTINGASYSLSQIPVTLLVNVGTPFTYSSPVNSYLPGVRFSLNGVTGPESGGNIVTNAGTITGSYVTQFEVAFLSLPVSGGSTSPSSLIWVNQGVTIPISATANSGYKFGFWTSILPPFITIKSSTSASTSVTINGPGIIEATFIPTVKITLSSSSGTVNPGHSVQTTATIFGGQQQVNLYVVSTLPKGLSVSFAHAQLSDSQSGVPDVITISASTYTPAGTYSISIEAVGADGQTSTTTYTLTVT